MRADYSGFMQNYLEITKISGDLFVDELQTIDNRIINVVPKKTFNDLLNNKYVSNKSSLRPLIFLSTVIQ